MRFSARVQNSTTKHEVELAVGDKTNSLSIAPKTGGPGSSVSGGELLMAALATCYCNDVYREAASMGIEVTGVDIECEADFPAAGAPGRNIKYTAKITARAPEDKIRELAVRTDRMAEIQNTVRNAIPVALGRVDTQTV